MPRILMTGVPAGSAPLCENCCRRSIRTCFSAIEGARRSRASEKFKAAELPSAQVEAICEGVDGILCISAAIRSKALDDILQSHIIGGYKSVRGARRRVSSASCSRHRIMR